ncbi:hypothetical protein NN561_003660 [Cricetulus griseus]
MNLVSCQHRSRFSRQKSEANPNLSTLIPSGCTNTQSGTQKSSLGGTASGQKSQTQRTRPVSACSLHSGWLPVVPPRRCELLSAPGDGSRLHRPGVARSCPGRAEWEGSAGPSPGHRARPARPCRPRRLLRTSPCAPFQTFFSTCPGNNRIFIQIKEAVLTKIFSNAQGAWGPSI